MRIFIELPTWLGDAVMATPSFESLIANYPDAKFVFFGSFVACEIFKPCLNCEFAVTDTSKKSKFRLFSLYKIGKNLGEFDFAISFRSSFASKILLSGIKAKRKFQFKKSKTKIHQVQKYLNFIVASFGLKSVKNELKIYFNAEKNNDKILAINPGASYGSAKRWYPKYFAEVAKHFKDKFKIIIFGGKNEKEICDQIEEILKKQDVECENLAGKTSIKELCEKIASISQNGGIFITNDSGPMHIAAAYKVKTIALFGPTKFDETSPWQNQSAVVLHLSLPCMPCMKSICPLGTHECMKKLTPQIAINAINQILQI